MSYITDSKVKDKYIRHSCCCFVMTINYEIQEQDLDQDLMDEDLEIDEDIQQFLTEFEEMDDNTDTMNDDELCVAMLDYDTNYTVKQLQLICEYYSIKTARFKKTELIVQIMLFENSLENVELVVRRREMWNYIDELKKDKVLKRFLLPM